MSVLTGQVPVSGLGAVRVPVRVEQPDGTLVATTVAARDGSWKVTVPAGEYVVAERWGRRYPTTATDLPDPPSADTVVGERHARRLAALREQAG